MEFTPIERAPGAFQRTVTAEEIRAMARRAFGAGVRVRSAVELGPGSYNSAYRVDVGAERAVILRVAPEPARQFRIERQWMRNEYAGVPYFAVIAPLLPRTLAADFTHAVIGRDYLFQTLLDGVPAPEGLRACPRAEWAPFFQGLGTIARDIHTVRGDRFGPMAGPGFATWGEAVVATLRDTAADLDDVGLDASDVREVAAAAVRHRALLDEITEPRLLHGDLWTANVMMAGGAPVPAITGVFDCDRASWGDPEADWTIFVAGRTRPEQRRAFRETYGPPASTPEAERRALFYQAQHLGAVRLERHRLGRTDDIPASYDEMRDVISRLRTAF
ncbi:aminoglycoside phosphotransferase family protein [Streptomyces sp. SL13]|uniref:Aminoglycoside phosphotransferase family protein n=1 Tax=Streptantibioticus silvisoli TaxID=2705255 RepID=A0AA90H756_9ACTN|nr:aminoglycoside phosphotransferase family protein [Streptantibioticus silvisoli]MDI5962200.1 aminoglycoside phosphotransferase family protein [Streptantibioticus silvisoli]MDI5972466.1 aminoglycoside phosphotransferase family protein [Streptantibioticus silvisoli]